MTTILFILHPTVEGTALLQYLSNDVILLDTIGEHKKKVQKSTRVQDRTGNIYIIIDLVDTT